MRNIMALTFVDAAPALAQPQPAPPSVPAQAEMTVPKFEMFRLARERRQNSFIRSVVDLGEVSVAGGQPKPQLLLHAGGKGWDVIWHEPARRKPTPLQDAVMAGGAQQ